MSSEPDNEPNYTALRHAYSAILRQMLPHLSADKAVSAVESVNSLVMLVRGTDWVQALDLTPIPAEILGMTKDGMVVYSESVTRLPFYHARPFDEVHSVVARTVEREPDLENALRELEALKQG